MSSDYADYLVRAVFGLVLRCPHCDVDIYSGGWYNDCSETNVLREDNYLQVLNDLVLEKFIISEHDEGDSETVQHECETTAHCSTCGTVLPWSTGQLRLEGSLAEVQRDLADLRVQAERKGCGPLGPSSVTG